MPLIQLRVQDIGEEFVEFLEKEVVAPLEKEVTAKAEAMGNAAETAAKVGIWLQLMTVARSKSLPTGRFTR